MIEAVPCSRDEANDFVRLFHRHNGRVAGSLFQVGASDGDRLVGVAIAGRPVSRLLQDGQTVEVLRCCVLDDAPRGACSFLYRSLWRAARALGYRKLITYTLASESGASLRGAGARVVAEVPPRNPAQWQSRPGREWHASTGQQKFRWELAA